MAYAQRKLIFAAGTILFFLVFGTFFFAAVENWNYVDAFYFTGITLTTVGYGDLLPTHDLSKIAAVFFAFAGIGLVFYSISIIGQRYFEQEEERMYHVWRKANGNPIDIVTGRVNILTKQINDIAMRTADKHREFRQRKLGNEIVRDIKNRRKGEE